MKTANMFRDRAAKYTERYKELCQKWGLEAEEFWGIV
jgi:acyl-CoA dehydrogenase